jgi:hypothetical protein
MPNHMCSSPYLFEQLWTDARHGSMVIHVASYRLQHYRQEPRSHESYSIGEPAMCAMTWRGGAKKQAAWRGDYIPNAGKFLVDWHQIASQK